METPRQGPHAPETAPVHHSPPMPALPCRVRGSSCHGGRPEDVCSCWSCDRTDPL